MLFFAELKDRTLKDSINFGVERNQKMLLAGLTALF
jgi:hypothetical protein